MSRDSFVDGLGRRSGCRRFGRVPTFGLVLLCLAFAGGGVWMTLNDQATAAAVDSGSKSDVAKSSIGECRSRSYGSNRS